MHCVYFAKSKKKKKISRLPTGEIKLSPAPSKAPSDERLIPVSSF